MNNQTQQSKTFHPSRWTSIVDALRDMFRMKSERDLMDEYLNSSTDIYDLEARMRSWDQRQRNNGGGMF